MSITETNRRLAVMSVSRLVTYDGLKHQELLAQGWRTTWIGRAGHPYVRVAWMEHPSTPDMTIVEAKGR